MVDVGAHGSMQGGRQQGREALCLASPQAEPNLNVSLETHRGFDYLKCTMVD